MELSQWEFGRRRTAMFQYDTIAYLLLLDDRFHPPPADPRNTPVGEQVEEEEEGRKIR
jgi:hypothetical protein